MKIVAKIGTSSLTDDEGRIRADAVRKLCAEVAAAREAGHQLLVVSSGAIGAGIPVLGLEANRPRDARTLQAVSAVGQSRLIRVYDEAFAVHGLVAGQVLLAPFDFFERTQYLHARGTLERLLELGVVPVVNENDAVADDAIRFGDNDRIAALVAHLVGADKLVLLTDMAGLYTADPRRDPAAELISEVQEITELHVASAGGAGHRGSGGMSSKVAAARIASWSGITTVIAAADRERVLIDAIDGVAGVGTLVHARPHRLSARKLWIAFAMDRRGTIHLDEGARRAVAEKGGSLLAVGVTRVEGNFGRGDAIEIAGPGERVFARGIAAVSAGELDLIKGRRTSEHPDGLPDEVVHRDELALLT